MVVVLSSDARNERPRPNATMPGSSPAIPRPGSTSVHQQPELRFDTAAGRYSAVLLRLGGRSRARRDRCRAQRAHSTTPSVLLRRQPRSGDEKERVRESMPGIRSSGTSTAVSRRYGVIPREAQGRSRVRRFWMVLDPTLRVLESIPFDAGRQRPCGHVRLSRRRCRRRRALPASSCRRRCCCCPTCSSRSSAAS